MTVATTNYFRIGPQVVFFDDFEEASIDRAYREARDIRHIRAEGGKVPPLSVFRAPKLSGPWDALPEIAGETVRPPFAVH